MVCNLRLGQCLRKSLTPTVGKFWHENKKPFRPTAGLGTYEKRAEERTAREAMKAREKEMKDEKEASRSVCSPAARLDQLGADSDNARI